MLVLFRGCGGGRGVRLQVEEDIRPRKRHRRGKVGRVVQKAGVYEEVSGEDSRGRVAKVN